MMMMMMMIKGALRLKLARTMVELVRGNQAIIDQISFEQLNAFANQLRTTKVSGMSLRLRMC